MREVAETALPLATVRHLRVAVVASALAMSAASGSADEILRTFDQDPIGAAPPGFSFAAARLAAAGRWLVRADGTNRYVAHLAEPSSGEGFALALVEGAAPADLRLS